IWVNIPGEGYVGVGEVLEPAVAIDDFTVTDDRGKRLRLLDLPVKAAKMPIGMDDIERAEFLVRVKWLKTVPRTKLSRRRDFSATKIPSPNRKPPSGITR